jgi:hypothetical protein
VKNVDIIMGNKFLLLKPNLRVKFWKRNIVFDVLIDMKWSEEIQFLRLFRYCFYFLFSYSWNSVYTAPQWKYEIFKAMRDERIRIVLSFW